MARCRRKRSARSSRSSGVDPKQIRGVGLTGQMHGAVLLDENGAVLRPAIIWCDQRTDEQCAWITETVGAKRLLELTCNPALTNFTLTKLLWVRQHEPEIWKKVRHVLLPKDYVRFRLSGEYAIDVADASGTLMLDVTHRRWSEEVLGLVDIDKALLPAVFESPEVCARVSARSGRPHRHSRRARRSSQAQAIRRRAPSAWASRGRAP